MIEHATEQQLQTYLDGELEAGEQLALEQHLRECDDCRTTLERQRALFRLIKSVPESAVEHDLAPRVLDRLEPSARWLPSLALGELLAALAIAAALLIGLGRATVELNLNAAWARLFSGLSAAAADLSASIAEAAALIPSLAPEDLTLLVPSPGTAWAIAALALTLWVVGNGLVLRRVRREG